ncbi:D-glycerate dehydrogenase [bacterium]|nr:MAG: D-glycerate dehydrogenase [bacterium]
MKPRVLVTEPIVEPVLDFLKTFAQVDVGERGTYSSEQALIDSIEPYTYLLSMLTCPVTKRVMETGKNLTLIANYAVGFNNIDIQAAKELNIRVANTPDVLTEATADTTMALLLSVSRNILLADKELREGKFDGWHPMTYLGLDFRKKKLGIFGMGRIGQAVAKRAVSFGFEIIYHNRKPLAQNIEESLNAIYYSDLELFLKDCDVLSIHAPLTPENRHSINANRLSLMKKGSYIINTARGPIIDEKALAESLISGHIAGAGLDVFELEPKIHPLLLDAPNTVLLPHIGSSTPETRFEIGMLAATAIYKHFNGETDSIPNLVC